MMVIILFVILGFIGILLFALGIVTGVVVGAEIKKSKEECEDER